MSKRADGKQAWLITVMLFLFMAICIADKSVFGLAALPMMEELKLTPSQFGLIGSIFSIPYVLSGLVTGFFLSNRFSAKCILLVMALLWACSLIPVFFVSSVAVIVASRILLGLGEGPCFTISIHGLYKWFSDKRRALPSSIVVAGAVAGGGFFAPPVVYLIGHHSWQFAFGVLGTAAFAWAVIWFFLGAEGPVTVNETYVKSQGESHVPYIRLITSRTILGVFALTVAAAWGNGLQVVWLPAFMQKTGGFSLQSVGTILVLPSIIQMLVAPALGVLSQRLIGRGVSSRWARGGPVAACMFITGIALAILSQSTSPALIVISVAIGFSISFVGVTFNPVLIAEVAPVQQRGGLMAVYSSVATLSGLTSTYVAGHLIEGAATQVAGYRLAFLLAGLVALIGSVVGLWLVNPEADKRRLAVSDNRRAIPDQSPAAVVGMAQQG
jgi:MFS family permease